MSRVFAVLVAKGKLITVYVTRESVFAAFVAVFTLAVLISVACAGITPVILWLLLLVKFTMFTLALVSLIVIPAYAVLEYWTRD